MRVIIYTAAVLFCATISQGDRCRFVYPVITSTIKCEDKVYHRDNKTIAAVNSCAQGKNGNEITIKDTNCIFNKLGFLKNGKLNRRALGISNRKFFPAHHAALTNGTAKCAAENSKESDEKDPFKHVECRLKVFRDVCKHETCDWLNTLD
ncbi:unnamed protein product [Allacma fusca]|uniref:Uncharacterized protein n=1 Tax=Allacma fusca TaxID=39272 RepID=A0A8J2JEA1_9HEXA|nr:unnamed protein product [Allacma fusca]